MELFCEDEKTAYYASADGEVWSLHKTTGRWFELKPWKNNTGYLQFNCCQNGVKKKVSVHRAVYEAFNGTIPDGFEINHTNCIPDDNRLDNLELVTHCENQNYPLSREHAREAKRHKMRPVRDLSTGVVYESVCQASRQLGLDKGSISNCCNGKQNTVGGHIFRFAS